MDSSKSGSWALGLPGSPGTPSDVNMRRSMPAQKLGPAPRMTTTRTLSGIWAPTRASPRHMLGVIALRRSGRFRVTVATSFSIARSRPAAVSSPLAADMAYLAPVESGSAKLSALSLGLAPGRAAAAAKGNTALTQDPVNESVGPAGRRGQRPDALASGVPLLQVAGKLSPVGTGDPGALLESLGHAFLPVS